MPEMGYHWTPCNGTGSGLGVIVAGAAAAVITWHYATAIEQALEIAVAVTAAAAVLGIVLVVRRAFRIARTAPVPLGWKDASPAVQSASPVRQLSPVKVTHVTITPAREEVRSWAS